ncbi:hypothetical protein BDK92_7340 [Micromonospora pisi]|uniref:Uncharacterized protein n=1 Tax=Micromonospora pisi TaxID=589240 RepID=A0A495JW93_9ACTN|nr:hypothetical protein [Micromonospora pisi]RKR92858.1 hypothetical protein BDK92_7340 [Micromonospora pisi]
MSLNSREWPAQPRRRVMPVLVNLDDPPAEWINPIEPWRARNTWPVNSVPRRHPEIPGLPVEMTL